MTDLVGSASFGGVLASVVPLAVIVAWSPLRILPTLVVVLQAARPRGAAIAFLLGSMAGLTAVTTASMRLSDDVDFTWVPGPPSRRGLRCDQPRRSAACPGRHRVDSSENRCAPGNFGYRGLFTSPRRRRASWALS